MSLAYSAHVDAHPDAEALFDAAVHRGARLAGTVRDLATWDIAKITDPLTRDELVATVVALACMVPVDRTPAQLLAWHQAGPVTAARYSTATLQLGHEAWVAGRRDQWAAECEREHRARAREVTP